MSVLVRFDNHRAILRSGVWMSADTGLERRLNETTLQWIRDTGGPSIHDRDQERSVAREMVRRFGGRVALHMKSRTGRSADYFFQQRQMLLEFDAYLPVTGRARRAASGR